MAVARCLLFQPERAWRVWSAWKDDVRFDPNWADTLLHDTNGLDRGLIAHWATTSPEMFAEVLAHVHISDSDRMRILKDALVDAKDERVRAAIGLPPLPPPDEGAEG